MFRKLALTGEFAHPLARAARVWTARKQDGSEQRVLVIVTTMELGPERHRYKKRLVEKLSQAAREYVAKTSDAAGFVIMNPPRHIIHGRSRPQQFVTNVTVTLC